MSVATQDLLLALRRPLLDFCDGLVPATARAWMGKRFSPEANQQYVADAISPSTVMQEGHPYLRARRTLRGLYVIQWYGLPNQGAALYTIADAVVALYPPGTALVTTDGNAVVIRDNPAPWAGEPRDVNGSTVVTGSAALGRTLITITVPYQCTTISTVAA